MLKKLICKIRGCCFKTRETVVHFDEETDSFFILETCCRCGKKYGFIVSKKVLDELDLLLQEENP